MNDKAKKRLDRLMTVVTIMCVLICLVVCVQVIQGKNASLFGFRIYHILTGSMEPTIAVDSKVVVRSVDPYKLNEGDIITFISKDPAIYGNANTHRIIEVTQDEAGALCFTTKGDANNVADKIKVYPEDIVGKVVFKVSSAVSLFLGFLHTKQGFVLVILFPFLLVIGLLMKEFKRDVKQYTNVTKTADTMAEIELMKLQIAEMEAKTAELKKAAENAEKTESKQ